MSTTIDQAADKTKATLDPDVLAGLETEREFLLRSLDDLDAELAAGDMDEIDHRVLADDYTRRLAEVARAIDEERAAFRQVDTKLARRQRLLTIVGIALLAIVAGVLLARASGFRSPDGGLTGGIRQSSSGLLAEADTLTREGRWPEALAVYDEVLLVAPGNVEALTYRGWLTARLGDNEAGLVDVLEAVEVDPTFPDARVFSAILLEDQQRFGEAAEQIAIFDSLDPPDAMLALVSQFDLRVSITAGQIKQLFDPIQPGQVVDLAQVDASLDDVARAGARLAQLGDFLLSQATFRAVLDEDPEQIIALVGKGQLARDATLFRENPDIAADAMQALDDAVALAGPDEEPVIRLYRADARLAQNNVEGARTDLLAVDRELLSPDLQALYDALSAEIA